MAAVTRFPVPKNDHEIRRFLGLADFFRRFMIRYAEELTSLTKLTGKNEPF